MIAGMDKNISAGKKKDKATVTDRSIASRKAGEKPRKYAVGKGLYIEVFPNGSKLWRYRYRVEGRENVLALGAYPEVTLEQAGEKHRAARALVKQGINPVQQAKDLKAHKVTEGANTFEVVAREWMDGKAAKWTPRYAKQVADNMQHGVFKFIGARPIREITAADLLVIVRRINSEGINRSKTGKGTRKVKPSAIVALNVQQWCSAVFRHAVATLRADTDPTLAIVGAIERPKAQHCKPLPGAEVKNFLTKLDQRGRRVTQLAMRLLMLLFTRTAELRQAEWAQFDLDQALWTIPPSAMKKRREHIVPLPRQAVVLLRELHSLTGGGNFCFRMCVTRKHAWPQQR